MTCEHGTKISWSYYSYFKRYCKLKFKNKAKLCVQICPIFTGPVTYCPIPHDGGMYIARFQLLLLEKSHICCIITHNYIITHCALHYLTSTGCSVTTTYIALAILTYKHVATVKPRPVNIRN